MKPQIHRACAVLIALWPGVASPDFQAWGPWSLPNFPSLIGTQFLHDDGGLTIMCDRTKHLISYILTEPRANWQKNSTIEIKVRADDGTETGPTHGHVLKADALAVLENRLLIFTQWVKPRPGLQWVMACMPASSLSQISERRWNRCCRHAAITGSGLKAFLLLVTWFTPGQPTTNYQAVFGSPETCETGLRSSMTLSG